MRNFKNHKVLLLIAGLVTAIVIVFSQVFFYQAADFCKNQIKAEQQDQDGSDNSFYLAAPSTSILSTSHVELNHEFSFVLEVLLNPDQDEKYEAPAPLSLGKLFRTLFNVIIAPNAP